MISKELEGKKHGLPHTSAFTQTEADEKKARSNANFLASESEFDYEDFTKNFPPIRRVNKRSTPIKSVSIRSRNSRQNSHSLHNVPGESIRSNREVENDSNEEEEKDEEMDIDDDYALDAREEEKEKEKINRRQFTKLLKDSLILPTPSKVLAKKKQRKKLQRFLSPLIKSGRKVMRTDEGPEKNQNYGTPFYHNKNRRPTQFRKAKMIAAHKISELKHKKLLQKWEPT